MGLEDLRREAAIFLVPEHDSDEEARGFLEKYCVKIFEELLDGWFRVPSAWPADRSFDTFVHWFEYSLHSVIVDLGDAPLKHDK